MQGIEAVYRNPMGAVIAYLAEAHGQNYMLFNLSEREYDTSKFQDQVCRGPFAPPLPLSLPLSLPPSLSLFSVLNPARVTLMSACSP